MKYSINSLKATAFGALLAGSVAVSAQEFTLSSVEASVGATEATLVWNYVAGGGVIGIGIFFDYDTSRLTAVTEDDDGTTVVSDCLGEEAASLPIAICQPTLSPPPQLSLGLSNLFSPQPSLQPGGSITFVIDPPLGEGESLPVTATLNEAGVSPGGTPVTVNGNAAIVASDEKAILNVQPPSLNFMNVTIDSTSPPQAVTISNQGEDGVDLQVTAINITGDFGPEGGGTCPTTTPFTLADGMSCTQHVEFSPSALGPATGTMTVTSNAGEAINDEVELTGNGAESDANLAIDPADWEVSRDINAGEICLNFELRNTGTDDSLTIDSAGLGSGLGVAGVSNGSAFSIGDDGCTGQTLAGGATCVVEVCFNPSEEGTSNDSLDVTSDANDVSAPLTGTGTAVAATSVNPPPGAVNLGESQAGETITVSTFGNQPIAVTNSGSADAEVSCSLTAGTDSDGVFSTDPSLAGPITVGAGATVPFSISCALPGDADDGDQFSATLSCDEDGEFAFEHELSCAVQAFQPIPINTLQPLGLALFALLMLLMGGISIRLFRAS